MFFLAFLLLLALSILVWEAGNRLVPLIMPPSRIRTVALGVVGGLVANLILGWFYSWGPSLAGINPLYALLGTVIAVLFVGVLPFLRLLLRRS